MRSASRGDAQAANMTRERRGSSRMRFGILSVALICFASSASALAHEAASGWQYPPGCCGGEDCHPVPCETIEEKRGVYIWKGVVFHRSMARVSGDDRCHVCVQFNGEGAASGRCLFLNFGM